MKVVSKKKLLNYIDHEQIAFKFSDGLICFTHCKEDIFDDLIQSITDFDEMKNFIIKSQNMSIVYKWDVVRSDDQFGFNEIAKWATNKDILILVDDELLLCLPNLYA